MSDNDVPNGYREGKGWIEIILADHTSRLERIESQVSSISVDRGRMSVWGSLLLAGAAAAITALLTLAFPKQGMDEAHVKALVERQVNEVMQAGDRR